MRGEEGVGYASGEGVGRCLDMLFSKILPEAKSVFIPMYNCCCCFFNFPKNRGEEKCAKVPCSHWKEKIERKCYLTENDFINLYLHTEWKRSVVYLSHSQRMFAVSLHLRFLAILLHFLLQFFLLLRRPVLLLTRLPASLPV